MSENVFNVGDVVILKSGGPKMTVNEMESDGWIFCQWFIDKKSEAGRFKAETLKAVKPVGPVFGGRTRRGSIY